MNRILKRWAVYLFAMSSLVVWTAASYAADANDSVEARTVRESQGAGIRVGDWAVQGLPAGVDGTQTPAFEGYFQKGLDVHLVWENSIGYWGHTYTTTQTGLLGSTQTRIQTHLVPSMTALKLYPFTTRADRFEPFVTGGLGAVFGIVQEPSGSGGSVSGTGGPSFATGLGIRAGGGFDWHWPSGFGMTAGARYDWATFGQTVGSQALYRGPAFAGGFTYRFQYR